MNIQKGFAKVTLLVVLVVVLAGGLVYFAFLKKPGEVAVSPTPTATANPTADWKTYTDSQYGFSFKYPGDYVVVKEGGSNGNVVVYSSSGAIDIYGNRHYIVYFNGQKTEKTLDQIIKDKTDNYALGESRTVTINGISAYEAVDLGMVSSYAVFAKDDSNLVEINFASGNDVGLEKNKAALTDIQKLILSTFKFTK